MIPRKTWWCAARERIRCLCSIRSAAVRRSATYDVVVHALPIDSIQVLGPTEFCEGDSVVLKIDHGGATGYRWSTGETSDTILVKRSGTYAVEITDTNGCVAVTPAREIIVHAAPAYARILPRDTVHLCADSAVTLHIGGTYSLIRWNNGVTGPDNRVTGGRYWATVYTPDGCTNASDTVTVVMYPRKTVAITLLGSNWLCPGDSVQLEASPGFATYRWSTGVSGRRIWARTGGSYTVTATDSNGCMVTSPPQVLNVLVEPTLTITVTPRPLVCAGETAILDAGAGKFKHYLWSTGDTTAQIEVRSSGWYTVAVETFDGCDGGTASQDILINPRPSASIAGPEEICAGTRATYTAPGKPGLRYAWSMTGPGSFQSSTNAATTTIAWGGAGSGTVTLTVTDPVTGCDSTTTLDITIGTTLVPRITAERLRICPGDSVELDAGDGYTEYTWTTGETTRSRFSRRREKPTA